MRREKGPRVGRSCTLGSAPARDSIQSTGDTSFLPVVDRDARPGPCGWSASPRLPCFTPRRRPGPRSRRRGSSPSPKASSATTSRSSHRTPREAVKRRRVASTSPQRSWPRISAASVGVRPARMARTCRPIALTRRRLGSARAHHAVGVGSRTLGLRRRLPGRRRHGGRRGAPRLRGQRHGDSRRAAWTEYRDVEVAGTHRRVEHRLACRVLRRRNLEGPRGEAWEPTEDAAKKRGAVAVLFLPDYGTLGQLDSRTAGSAEELARRLTVDAFGETRRTPGLPTATLAAPARRGPSSPGRRWGHRRSSSAPCGANRRRRFPDRTRRPSASRWPPTEERLTTFNVVATLEGSHPTLKQEYVAVGAHYDHLGVGERRPTGTAGRIHNGADDDGSGTVGGAGDGRGVPEAGCGQRMLLGYMLAPKQGLWGSRYFTEHPDGAARARGRAPEHRRDRTQRAHCRDSAATNGPLALTDMDSVYVVGSRRHSPTLGRLWSSGVNARYHGLRLDFSLDGRTDYRGRSTSAAITTSTRNAASRSRSSSPASTRDYHGLDDEIDRIDFPKMRRIVQTIYGTARTIANRPARPRVDAAPSVTGATPENEFLAGVGR